MSQIPQTGRPPSQPSQSRLPLVGYDRFRKAIDFGNAATNCFDFEEALAFLCSPTVEDSKGKRGLIASPVYLVDPCQAGFTPLKTQTLNPINTLGVNRNTGAGAASVVSGKYHSQFGGADTFQVDLGSIGQTQTSAINTANTLGLDIANCSKTLAINVSVSAGAPTFAVSASQDNTTFITIDTGLAVGPKQYVEATVGASTALSPLSFRYIKIVVGAAGAGNTSTVVASAK